MSQRATLDGKDFFTRETPHLINLSLSEFMIGTKLSHYEITSHLGTGGMGEVYQASDSKLGRSVAIKLLPEAFSHDSERVARFERAVRRRLTRRSV